LNRWKIDLNALTLFQLTSAMNGSVMFLYAAILFYVNRWRLPAGIRIAPWRMAILGLTVVFFGAFTLWAAYDVLAPLLGMSAAPSRGA
jgi:hypothetical protein